MTVTCYCSAYPFPHRLNGGKCSVHTFADWYIEHRGYYCEECERKTRDYGYTYCSVADMDSNDCPAFDAAQYHGVVK